MLFAVPLTYSRLELDIVRLVPRHSARIVLVDDDEQIAIKAAKRLTDLGYNNVYVLQGGNPAWKQAGYMLFCGVNVPSKAFGELVEEQTGTPQISAPDLFALQASKQKLVVIDGRPYNEYQKMNIPGAISCPNGELAYRWHKLVPDDDTVVVINCAGRTRSILGAQTLINLGVKNPVYALENGTQGWVLSDFTLEHGSTRKYPDVNGSDNLVEMANSVRTLADKLSVPFVDAHQVLEWRKAGDTTIYLCDVRTQEEYQANTIAGAQHTPGGQLIQATDQYIGVQGARLVLFDSDGIRAPVVASWLRQLGHDAYVLKDTIDSANAVLQVASWMGKLPQPDLPEVTAKQLHDWLESDQDVVVIDVRASAAYQQAHIPSAQWG
ncbi:sulfurtransferase, partial [Photobacterium phosphoreum]|nr:sulfurtransferase [Photobacterium phosphoreum]